MPLFLPPWEDKISLLFNGYSNEVAFLEVEGRKPSPKFADVILLDFEKSQKPLNPFQIVQCHIVDYINIKLLEIQSKY